MVCAQRKPTASNFGALPLGGQQQVRLIFINGEYKQLHSFAFICH